MEGKPITPAQNSSNLSASPESDQQVLKIWGRQPLAGHVKISGAKNSALVVMAGTLLCPDDCRTLITQSQQFHLLHLKAFVIWL